MKIITEILNHHLIRIFTLLTIFCAINLDIYGQATNKEYKLWYSQPAPNNGGIFYPKQTDRPIDVDWENWSLPIGNGYMGASVFGRTDSERLQITDKTLYIKGLWGSGTHTAFADLYIDFFHHTRSTYERGLSLNDGLSYVNYQSDYVNYSREYFMSYPDNVLVVKLKSSKPGKLTFTVRPEIPYLEPFGKLQNGDRMTKGYLSAPFTLSRHDNNGRTGKVTAKDDRLTLRGACEYLNLVYEGQLKVIPYNGKLISTNDVNNDHGTIKVSAADSAVLIFSLGTNYKLESKTFLLEPYEKLKGNEDPHELISKNVNLAAQKGYEELLRRHKADYQKYFSRVNLDLGSTVSELPTDKLLENYKNGKPSTYLEELFFQYGRYLLISSSRKGALPATLQGVWNQYELAPWNGNYTHNINIQMNYWPSFNTNLLEMFESYVDYFKAYREASEIAAEQYLKITNSKFISSIKGENGWTMGTGSCPYHVGMPGGHSGPGTGGFTAKMFADYYEFNADKKILEDVTYPAVVGMGKFLSKAMRDTLGYLLAYPSSSPEQYSKATNKPYPSVGCAYDQQMIYENHHDILKYSKGIKDVKNSFLKVIKSQIDNLDPVQVGASGQIKEYREENFYGDIVLEKNHRHVSNLIGLYPGTLINSNTPAWLDAAKVTLNNRGDLSTGWSMAHKLNLWARTKSGDRAYDLYQDILKTATLNNLWTNCIAVLRSPYMIDANLGSTAGVGEMLLQSHEGFIEPLAALPQAWSNGSYSGLLARGNFEVSATWQDGAASKFEIYSRKGNECQIKYNNITQSVVRDNEGKQIKYRIVGANRIAFQTVKGGRYTINSIPQYRKTTPPKDLTSKVDNNAITLKWKSNDSNVTYSVYKANGNNPNYELIKKGIKGAEFVYQIANDFKLLGYNIFRVTATNSNGIESEGVTICVNK